MSGPGVVVIGAAMTPFGIFLDQPLRALAARAADAALDDAGVDPDVVGLVAFGNAGAGILTGQEMIRAQTSLGGSRLAGRPMLSVENACTSSSSAFHVAYLAVASGSCEVAVAMGAERMSNEDRSLAGRALATGVDVEAARAAAEGGNGSDRAAPRPVFMEIYAAEARRYMERSGATAQDFADVTAKNRHNGSLNPSAQHRVPLSAAAVLADRSIVPPLTRPMCSSIGDGAAALVLCSPAFARRQAMEGVGVLASVIQAGTVDTHDVVTRAAATAAYERAGVGPRDIDVFEVHDAAAPAELTLLEEIGLVGPGDGPKVIREGWSHLGGETPVNPSGGLIARGHPVGATGAAQLVEIVDQLRGRAGARQVSAQLGLAQSSGGSLGQGPAASAVTILAAP